MTNEPIVFELKVDKAEMTAKLITSGDLSHYHNVDNPIIEFFRAINFSLMRNEKLPRRVMHYAIGFPEYDKRTKTTSCLFRLNCSTYFPSNPNLTPEERLEEMGKFMAEDFALIEKKLKKLLEAFLCRPEGLTLYEKYKREVFLADDADSRSKAVEITNVKLKGFILSRGYRPVSGFKVPEQFTSSIF